MKHDKNCQQYNQRGASGSGVPYFCKCLSSTPLPEPLSEGTGANYVDSRGHEERERDSRIETIMTTSEATGTEPFDGVVMVEDFPEKGFDNKEWTENLKFCVGDLSIPQWTGVLTLIEQKVRASTARAVEDERQRIEKIITAFKDRNDGDILKDIGFSIMEYPAPAARKVCWKLLEAIKK